MTQPPNNITPLRKQIACPNCSKPSNRGNYPFCSKRCADQDLGKWLGGTYTATPDEQDEN